MTKEYREYAKSRIEYLLKISNLDERDKEALEAAIQALSQEPTIGQLFSCEEVEELRSKIWKQVEQEPCTDAVSREAVYSILNEYHIGEEEIDSAMDECQNLTVNAITSDVSLLPSVTQSITRDIEKSNFSQEQYLLDTDSAYQIGYEQGHKDAEQKSGKWIMHERHRECSECGVYLPKDMPRNSYCPNCGAKMESEDKE